MSISPPPINSPHDDRGFFERSWAAFFGEITGAVEDTPNTQTVSFAAGESYRYLVDASAGAVTVSLPSIVGLSTKGYSITKTDSSANTVTIDPDGSETILGAATLIISTQYDTADIFPTDDGWLAE